MLLFLLQAKRVATPVNRFFAKPFMSFCRCVRTGMEPNSWIEVVPWFWRTQSVGLRASWFRKESVSSFEVR